MNKPIATLFPSLFCASFKEITSSWSGLFDELKDVKSYRIKNNAPLIKLAKFGKQKSSKGSLKHDENLVELWGIEGDYDGGAISIDEAGKLLEKHNIRAILYSTWSCTSDIPRWRVLVPLSKPFPKTAHCKMLSRLNGALGGILARESFTVAQAYFIGKNPNQPYTCICTFSDTTAGTYIDLLEGLDQISIGREEKTRAVIAVDKLAPNSWLLDLLDGQDINGNALRLVGRMVAKGLDDQTIRDTFEGWKDELTEKRGSERVADLFGGELERMIKGARDKGFAPKTLDDVLSDLRKLSPQELRKNCLDLVVNLSHIDRSTALQEVSRLSGIKLHLLKHALRQKDDDLKQEHRNDTIASRVGERFKIIYLPENIATTADWVEAAVVKQSSHFELARFAGVLVRVVVEAQPLAHYADSELPPSPTVQTDTINKTKLLPLVERAVVFQASSNQDKISNISVPPKILDHILDNPKTIPSISAIVTHPLVTGRGRIISETGIDHETGLLLCGNHDYGLLTPYSKVDSIKAIARIKSKFLKGFEFSSELDKAAALSLLFTAIERKLMPAAPGGFISASQPSTGKTTFVRVMHAILTGRDSPVMCLPEKNEAEVQKMLLTILLNCPELIFFDNLGEGLTLKSPVLASAMTSPVFEGRILGASRDASAPTNVMMIVTGNNIKLANDEVYRWIKVNLKTSNLTPHKRKLQYDGLNYGLSIRDEVIRDCLGIIAGYLNQTEHIEYGSRFPEWDKLVRQPLMWVGELDVGCVFDENIAESAEMGAEIALLNALHEKFKGAEFGSGKLICDSNIHDSTYLTDLDLTIIESMRALHAKDLRSAQSIGFCLGKLVGKTISMLGAKEGTTLTLTSRPINGLTRYRVEVSPFLTSQ